MLLDFAEKNLAPHDRSALAAHLQECAHCRAALSDIHQFLYITGFLDKNAWGAKSECPSPDELVALSESPRNLEPERLEEIKRHLLECYHCNEELKKLISASKQMKKPEFETKREMPDRLKAVLKRAVRDRVRTGAASGEPVFISVEGALNSVKARKFLSATGREAPPGQESVPLTTPVLSGTVTSKSGSPVPGEWVSLFRNNRRTMRLRTSRSGYFRF